ncbi:nickel transporter [Kitasatospora sp. NPDC002040]|uniref:nickel transporter n=1 Tax=Kitasatospora sp. NPDC002040 TaxID=3154661 RepID=UPI003331EC45
MNPTARWLAVPAVALLALAPVSAAAHPLGNFSVNRYDGLRLLPDRIVDTVVVDTAEIPTAQDRTAADRNRDGTVDAEEAALRAGQRCAELAGAVRAVADGRELAWQPVSSGLSHRPGAAGLATARLGCELVAAVDLTRPVRISFHSGADRERLGWKEITAVGEGVALRAASVPRESSSDALDSYPAGSAEQPLGVVTAEISADGPAAASRSGERRGVPPLAVGLPALGGIEQRLASLTTARDLTVPVGLAAIALALLLGAGHAALPGHAKLAVAACLTGTTGPRRGGGVRAALAVGATVTVTHTAGVLVVGLALTASTALVGDRLLSRLGLLGGALVAVIGALLVRTAVRTLRGRADHGGGAPDHDHGHHEHHGHDHGGHHDHGHGHRHGGPHLPSLLGVGLAGGLVPSPSALVILLGAVALGRTSFGVLLVLGYGLGMALALTAAGLLLSGGGTRLAGLTTRRIPALRRLVPYGSLLTALVVLAVGLGLALRGAVGG